MLYSLTKDIRGDSQVYLGKYLLLAILVDALLAEAH